MQRTAGFYLDLKIFFPKSVLGALVCFVILTLPALCDGHSDENPGFKYSQQANENVNTINKFQHDAKNYHEHGSDHTHGIHHEPVNHKEHIHSHDHRSSYHGIDMSRVWLHAIGSTLLISAAPFVLLYIIPLDNSEAMRPRLKVILAFASGGLLGDAFLHLIPHATNPHDHHAKDNLHHNHETNHSHDMSVGLWVLGGIITFLAVEKLVRILKGETSHRHIHSAVASKKPTKSDVKTNKKLKKLTNEHKEIEISGYLNLAADFAHNFTDGLAIGASYLAGNNIGIITTITILLHEVPHEIGDFAILIKSGCSRRKAMMLQLLTAVGAIAGTSIALFGAGGENMAASWVLPFTAGGFIYIATVSVLPELLEESTKLIQSIKEITALLSGVGLMVFIANFE